MGNVSSRPDDPLLLRDQDRLSITSIKITNSRNRVLYTITPNAFPATRLTVRRELDDDLPIEYIQDPDQQNVSNSLNFLLRLSNHDDIFFYFTFVMRQSQATSPPTTDQTLTTDTVINSLTFLFASTPRELETLVTREFNADPNLHRNPNVDLLGDYTTAGNAVEHFEWSWKWRPPKVEKDRGGGWRNSCSFVEYDQRAHKLNTLATFSFWVNGNRTFGSPKSPTRLLEPTFGTRVRVPSAQSVESRLSDSDTDLPTLREPPSPNIEATIPEDALSIDNGGASNAIKVDINYQKPGQDVSEVDDGPLFRATMKALEQKTGNMKIRMKQVLKRAEAARESQLLCHKSVAAFLEALRGASSSNANAVQPALDHYFEKIATEILSYEKRNSENLQKLIIDPLSKLYNSDIKQVESKRRDFEDDSKEYYQYVSKYLGQRQDSLKEKKRAESDSKYDLRRRNFELKRFDYSSFMQDLHGGRKDQEVLSQLTKYADAQAKDYLSTGKRIEVMMPQLEALVAEVREADKEYQLIRTGREEKRRTLEKGSRPEPDSADAAIALAASAAKASPYADTDASTANGSTTSASVAEKRLSGVPLGANLSPQMSNEQNLSASIKSSNSTSPGQNVFKGYRDLEERDTSVASSQQEKGKDNIRREGLLWSLSRPSGGHYVDPKSLNKQAWHKYWITLDQGRLSEYVNWKDRLEQHREPIDLRVASVREARNAERRFCFEVITPNFTRVYQAQTDEEMKSWIQHINNALQSAFESKSPMADQKSSTRSGSSMARDLFGKSSSYHGHRSTSSAGGQLSQKHNVARHATVGDRPQINRSRSSEERPAHLLQSIRDADAGNSWCADCNSDVRVEWVSINLGIIICIECSGIHRSLGTHITKIRSLTLDTVSFTQDITELLLRIGNRVSNMVWEATLDPSSGLKPTPNSARDHRLRFITAKYAKRSFVSPHPTPPNDLLLASIKTENLSNVIHALALSANPNSTDRSRSTHAVFLALAAADPASPANTLTSSTSAADQKDASRKSFPLAELLLQNGADIPATAPPIPLGKSAWLYLEYKREQKSGRGLGIKSSPRAPTSAAVISQSVPERGSSISAQQSHMPYRTPPPIIQEPSNPQTTTAGANRLSGDDQGRASAEGDKLTALPIFDGRKSIGRTQSNTS